MSSEKYDGRKNAGREFARSLQGRGLEQDATRKDFFADVYDHAEGDAAAVPWAGMEPKAELLQWLEGNHGHHGSAVDIGCGLGDNAEALADHGYKTVGFDFSPEAIDWAKKRFPQTAVDYVQADLFDLPAEWKQKFQLVHECYTLQSLPPETLANSIPATASLVAPGGALLVYARVREDGAAANGPPWPLEISQATAFEHEGLVLENRKDFILDRGDKTIPHMFAVWRRPE